MISQILNTASSMSASDIHIAVGRLPHARIHGDLLPLTTFEIMTQKDVLELLVECIGQERAKKVIHQEEVDFSYFIENGTRFRGHAYLEEGIVALVFRVIEAVKAFESLSLPPQLKDFAFKKQGFFLVVGPVGQGKSTTLASLIDVINRERREHIVTIEDPIEYRYDEINCLIDQREVGVDTISFESGLHAAFRQDINVILIGEMRSSDTISTAITAAETGHLVFSTLHTNSAAQTIDRIIDSFPPEGQKQIRNQLAASLLGIFSQRLVKSQKGGRAPAFELLINTSAVANLIREGRTHEINTVIETSRADGMITLNHSLIELVRSGHLTLEQAKEHSLDPDALSSLSGM
jgi:twitching motility protein PilT